MPNEDSGFVFNIPTTTKAYDDLVSASTTKRESLLATSAAKIAALDAIDAQRELDLKEFALGRGRLTGEFAQDQAVGLAKGAISLNEILYGVGEAALAPGGFIGRGLAAIPLPGGETLGKAVGGQAAIHMEDLTGIAPTQFAEDRATLQTMKTEKGRYVDEKVQKSLIERAAGKGERIAEAMKSGRSENVATILDEIGTIGSTIGAYADNPAAAIDAAVEQLPQLLGAGVAGSVARATAVKGMAKHEAAAYVSSAAGKEALVDISTKAGVAYTAVSEGASNAVAAKGEILNMSHEDLFDGSPLYVRLVGEGMSHEEARMQVSDKVFNATFGLAAAVGGVAAKVTGAAKFEGNLFNADSAVKGVFNKALEVGKDTFRETVEESIQGGAGTLASNIAKQAYADKSQELSEGVGKAIGAGAVIGGIAGGSISAVTQVAKGTGEAKEAVKGAVAKKATDDLIVKTVGESGDFSAVTDVNVPDYNIEVAVKAIVANSAKEGTTPEQKTENFNTARDIVLENYDRINKLLEETPTPELQKQFTKEEKLQESATKLMFTLQESQAMQAPEVTTAVENVTPESTDRLLGSTRIKPDSVSIEQYEKVLESVKISDAQREEIQDHIKVETAIKDMTKVNKDIIEGGKGFLGIRNFQSMINASIQKADITGAEKAQERLETFATRHTEKAELAAKAYSGDKDAIAQYLEEYENVIHPPRGGKSGSQALVNSIREESDALNAAVVQGANTIARASGTETAPTQTDFKDKPNTTVKSTGQVRESSSYQQIAEENKGKKVQVNYGKGKVFGGTVVGTTKVVSSSNDGEYVALEIKTNTGKIVTADPNHEIRGLTINGKIGSNFIPKSTGQVEDKVEALNITAEPSPKAFSSMVRMGYGEPISLIAKNAIGEEIGRLIYMPNGGPIDVFVKETERRKGVGKALYAAHAAAGGKLMPEESGVVISDAARALRASRNADEKEVTPTPTEETPTGAVTEPVKETPVSNQEEIIDPSVLIGLPTKIISDSTKLPIQNLAKIHNRILEIYTATLKTDPEFNFESKLPTTLHIKQLIAKAISQINKLPIKQDHLQESVSDIIENVDDIDDIGAVFTSLTKIVDAHAININQGELFQESKETPVPEEAKAEPKADEGTVEESKEEKLNALMEEHPTAPRTLRVKKFLATNKTLNESQLDKSIAELEALPKPVQEKVVQEEPVVEKAPETGVELDLLAPSMSEAIVGTPVEVSPDATVEERTTNFYNQNQVQQNFEIIPPKENEASPNALIDENDFVERLDRDSGIALRYVDQKELTPEQQANIDYMVRFDKELKIALGELFKKKDTFKHQDFMQYLVNEDGSINPNIQSAITMNAYNWLATSAGSTLYNSEDLINTILNRDKDAFVTDAMRDHLERAGITRGMLTTELGKDIYKTLGIRPKKGSPGNQKALLESSLGSMAAALLLDTGYLEEKTYPVLEIQNLIPKEELAKRDEIFTEEDAALHATFYRVPAVNAVNDAGFDTLEVAENVNQIIEVNKSTDGLLDKLFKIQSNKTGPTTEPVKKIPKTVKGNNQELTKDAKTVIKKLNATAYHIKTEVLDKFKALSPETQLKLSGYKVDPDKTEHIAKRKGVHAKNASIEIQLKSLYDFATKFKDIPAYFAHEIWKQGRIGVLSNSFNMLSSTIHRHFAKLDTWNSEVNFDNKDEVDQFYLAFGESFGISTDKYTANTSLAKIGMLLENPKLVAAVEHLNSDDALDDQIVLAALEEGRGDVYSFDGLVNLARMWKASVAELPSFQSDLFREVDGKTNGPAIGILNLFAGASKEAIKATLNRAGMFFDGVTTDFGKWLSDPSNLDIYEVVVRLWEKDRTPPKNKAALARHMAAIRLFGTLDRDDTKGAVTKTVYGSSDASIVDGLVDEFMDKIYSKIKDAASNTDVLQDIQNDIAVLTGETLDLTVNPLDQEFSYSIVNALDAYIRKEYAESLTDVMAQEFGDFRTKGKAINSAMGTVFEAFQLMYENEVAKKTAEGIAAGSLIEGATTLSQETLDGIEKSLIDAQPIMATFLSKDVNDGLFVGKYKTVRGKGNAFKTKQEYLRKPKNSDSKSITTQGTERVMDNPGAAPTASAVQSIDSATMTRHLIQYSAMGVHDAIIVGQAKALTQGKAMNESFLEVHEGYSIMSAAQETLDRAINTLVDYDAANGTDFVKSLGTITLNGLSKADKETLGDGNAINFVQNRLATFASNINEGKLQLIDEIKSGGMLAQYFVSGGELKFKPTPSKTIESANKQMAKTVAATATDQPRTPQEIDRDTLGSTGATVNPADFTDPATDVTAMNSIEVFESLGQISDAVGVTENPVHDRYLKDLLADRVNTVLEPFKLHMQNRTDTENVGATDTLDMYIINQINGPTPISGMLANGIRMSSQEVYLHELIHNVSRAAIDKINTILARRLKKLWHIVKNDPRTTVEMFMADPTLAKTDPTYAVEYAAAKIRYDHIFTPVSREAKKTFDTTTGLWVTTETADYLHEFMAFGMTNARFMAHLTSIKLADATTDPIFEGNALERLSKLMQAAFDAVANFFLKTPSGNAQAQMDGLFNAMTNIDVRKKTQIQDYINKTYTFTEKSLNEGIAFTKNQLLKVVDATKLREAKSVFVRVGAKGAAIVLSDERAAAFGLGIEKIRESIKEGKQGFISTLITEVQGRTENNGTFHDLNRVSNMVIDQQRRAIKTVVSEVLLESYSGELSTKQRDALSKILIKTDITALLDFHTLQEIDEFIRPDDVTKLIAEISRLESELDRVGGVNNNFYKRASRNLGLFMAQGRNGEEGAYTNARQIATLTGTGWTLPHVDVVDQTEVLSDRLATLYSLTYSNKDQRRDVSDLIRSETAVNPQENGITFTLHQIMELKKESKKSLFGDFNAMMKGYTKDITNPHIDVIYAPASEETELARRMYKKQDNPIPRDPLDPDQTEIYAYVSKDGGLATHSAGIMSLTSMVAAGTSLGATKRQAGDPLAALNGRIDTKKMKADKQAALNAMRSPSTRDPALNTKNIAVPVFNKKREITGYRYMMSEANKDSLLEKNNEFQLIMGGMAANITDKIESETINTKTIEALKAQYDEDFSTKYNSYVKIGPNVDDKALREIYYMLPYSARMEVRRVWNGDVMQVRNDLIPLVFGQRKISATDIWKEDPDTIHWFKRSLIYLAELFLRKQAAGRLRRVENVWQELIKMIKDVIVIKTLVVTAANTVSNMLSLWALGVSKKDILKGHMEGFSGAVKYQADAKELHKLERIFASNTKGTVKASVNMERIAELKNELAKNPVRELVEAGVFQTIVEDIEAVDDAFSYKSKTAKGIAERTEKVTSKIPKGIKTVASNFLVLQNSKTYKVLNQAAQLSDFVARYTLHKHYTTRAVDPLSKKDSIAKIVSIFIDYDLPTHKAIQYGNDMGLIWFTKYNIRIQKILWETMKANPARVMMLMAMQGVFGDLPDQFDGSILTKDMTNLVKNPLGEYDIYGEVFTINALDNLL